MKKHFVIDVDDRGTWSVAEFADAGLRGPVQVMNGGPGKNERGDVFLTERRQRHQMHATHISVAVARAMRLIEELKS